MSEFQNRASCWSVTLNNPTEADEECIALARQRGWKVEGQKERGESGTVHYQLMVRTPQVRFSAMKKVFPRGHIEYARNPSALSSYVRKEMTRIADLPVASDRYPSLAKFWDLVIDQLDSWNYINYGYIWEPRFERPPFWWKEAPTKYHREPLHALDDVTAVLIEKGYYVESMACNPQVRMAWRKFHGAIAYRHYEDKDRQTDNASAEPENNVAVVDIPTHATPSASSPSGLLEGGQREEEGSAPGSGAREAGNQDSDSSDREAGGSA